MSMTPMQRLAFTVRFDQDNVTSILEEMLRDAGELSAAREVEDGFVFEYDVDTRVAEEVVSAVETACDDLRQEFDADKEQWDAELQDLKERLEAVDSIYDDINTLADAVADSVEEQDPQGLLRALAEFLASHDKEAYGAVRTWVYDGPPGPG